MMFTIHHSFTRSLQQTVKLFFSDTSGSHELHHHSGPNRHFQKGLIIEAQTAKAKHASRVQIDFANQCGNIYRSIRQFCTLYWFNN